MHRRCTNSPLNNIYKNSDLNNYNTPAREAALDGIFHSLKHSMGEVHGHLLEILNTHHTPGGDLPSPLPIITPIENKNSTTNNNNNNNKTYFSDRTRQKKGKKRLDHSPLIVPLIFESSNEGEETEKETTTLLNPINNKNNNNDNKCNVTKVLVEESIIKKVEVQEEDESTIIINEEKESSIFFTTTCMLTRCFLPLANVMYIWEEENEEIENENYLEDKLNAFHVDISVIKQQCVPSNHRGDIPIISGCM